MPDAAVLRIFVAALGGAAVGVERQRSGDASGAKARLGGVRTFTLLGGIAGLAGLLATLPMMGPALVLAGGAVLLVIISYAATSRRGLDATTEAAALVVIGAGFVAGLGSLALASGIIAVSTLLLVEKSYLHALVSRIDDEELRAAARFGVMAIVILPLLPEGPYGPLGGVKPRELWLLVLFFTGLSFAGYLARRMFGVRRGYPIAGLLAGMVSSTTATFTFARNSRHDPEISEPLAVGAVAACTMLYPRVLAATMVLDPRVAMAVLPYLAAPFVAGMIALAIWWRVTPHATPHAQMSNPLQIGPALRMAATFQVVLLGVTFIRGLFGAAGVLASGAVLGLTDVDALTISMAKSASAGITPRIAAQAIAGGVLVNCVMKTTLAVTFGTKQFARWAGAAIAAMGVATAAALAISIGR